MIEKSDKLTIPTTIYRHFDAVIPAFAVLAGMQLDVFTPLKNGPMSAETLAKSLNVQAMKLQPLLYSLVMADLLNVENGIFSNTDEANCFLVSSSPGYIGGWVSGFYNRRWNAVLQTAKTIRTGKPQAKPGWQTLEEDRLFEILGESHPVAVVVGKQLAEKYDFTKFKNLLDAGSGTGGLTIGLCESCPNIKGTVVDLPRIVPFAEQFVSEGDMSNRIRVIATDLIDRPPEGTYDVAVLRALIQTLAPNEVKSVLKNIGKAMESGGFIYILGYVVDDTRMWPKACVDWNLHFFNIYDDGQAFTESEHSEWLSDAGFGDISIDYEALPSRFTVVSARKT